LKIKTISSTLKNTLAYVLGRTLALYVTVNSGVEGLAPATEILSPYFPENKGGVGHPSD
jgi:hypothetical protein